MIEYLFILAAALFRIFSYATDFFFLPPNFAPIGGMALFSGYYLADKKAIWIPLIALALSDLIIGLYDPLVMVSVYASFIAIVFIGKFLKKHPGVLNGLSAVLASSLLFFLVTNFAEWARPESFYPHTIAGLLQSYAMGLPFFRFTLAGDILFTALFFGAYQVVQILLKNILDNKKDATV